MKPGEALLSVATISSAPAGKFSALQGPTDSITPSRMRMPASGSSPLEVKARPTCRSVVLMAETSWYRKPKRSHKQNGQDAGPAYHDKLRLCHLAMAMLASFKLSPSTLPLTVT